MNFDYSYLEDTPRDLMARLRLQKIFQDEARAHTGSKAIYFRCPITGAKSVKIAREITPEIAPISPFPQPLVEIIPTFQSDFPHFAELARQKFLRLKLEGATLEKINAETFAHSQRDESLPIRQGPAIDYSQMETSENAVGEFADHFEGEADFREICASETGRIMEVQTASERWAGFRLQCEQTERLADALESAGMRVRCVDPADPDRTPDCEGRAVRPALWFVPAGEPEQAIKMPNVQRLNAFPTVAASRHAEVARSLRYFAEREPFIYMATLTSGSTLRHEAALENINAENKRFHGATGEMIRHRFFKRHARAILLGMEFGSFSRFIASWRVHHHGHLLYTPERWTLPHLKRPVGFTKNQWSRFRRWVRLRLAALMRYDWKAKGFSWRERARGVHGIWEKDELHCELGNRLANINEACKYPIKGQELDTLLNEAGPAAVRTFFEQTKGLRLITPYGEFRRLRREVKRAGKRFVIVTTPDGKVVEIRRNWNKGRSNCDPQRAKNRARWKRLNTEKHHARRAARVRREFTRLIARPANQLWRIQGRIINATEKIAERHRIGYYQAVRSAYIERRYAIFSELRDLAEIAPESVKNTRFSIGENTPEITLADLINHPIMGDFRDYLARCALPVREIAPDFENAPEIAPDAEKETPRNRPPLRNHLMARCAPFASGKWRVSQPVFAVIGYEGDFGKLVSQNKKVAELVADTRSHIASALAAQARTDALPPLRPVARVVHARTYGRAAAPARVPGSHYPHNSQGAAAPPLHGLEFDACDGPPDAVFETLSAN